MNVAEEDRDFVEVLTAAGELLEAQRVILRLMGDDVERRFR